jgi:uncharacterized protein
VVSICLEQVRPDGSIEHIPGEDLVLRVDGHSGLGVRGGDVVCAGISAVVQTAICGIRDVAHLGQKVTAHDGYLETRIAVGGDERGNEALRVILLTMLSGLREIEKEYPGSLKIIYGG